MLRRLLLPLLVLVVVGGCSASGSDAAPPSTTRRSTITTTTTTTTVAITTTTAAAEPYEYDAAKMAEKVQAVGDRQLKDYGVGTASCPKAVDVTEGVTFTCTLPVADVEAPFTVTLTKVDRPIAHYEVVLAKALIERTAAEAFVKENLTGASAASATVTCGDGKQQLILAAPGSRVSCEATVGSRSATFRLRVEDVQGHVVLEQ